MSVLRSFASVAEAKTLSVLLRPDTSRSTDSSKRKNLEELRSLGVSFVTGDLAELSVADIAEVLRPFDTVVSCTGFVGGPAPNGRS